jgi:glycosyltransferase involved in cell wall biosynthesis
VAGGREGLTIVGPVPDALEFLQAGRAVAVPSVSGAGIQVKTLDALASGRRVVATTTAMRGIAEPPPTVIVADEPAAFADALEAAARAGDDGEAAALARTWAVDRRERFRAQVADAVSAVAT